MKKNRSYLPQHDKGHLQILRASIMLNGGKVKAFFLKYGKIKYCLFCHSIQHSTENSRYSN